MAGIAPQTKIEQLNRWADSKGIERDVAGPPIALTELPRLQRKISEQLSQLPEDKPGILVIPALTSFLFLCHTAEEVLDALQAQSRAHPNLFMIIVSEGYNEPPPGDAIDERYGLDLVIRKHNSGLQERILLVRNQAFDLSISPSTLSKIETA